MDVNNNSEINKMFGGEEYADHPDLQGSPLGDSEPGSSPFQDENGEYSRERQPKIGNHNGFGFAKEVRDGAKRVRASFAALLCIALTVAGVAGGAIGCYAYFFGLSFTGEEEAAATAMELVEEYMNESPITKIRPDNDKLTATVRFNFIDVCVRNRTNEYECVVFVAYIYDEDFEYATDVFRVIVPKDGGDNFMHGVLDEEEYRRLSGGSEAERAQAAILMNRQENLERALEEIFGDSPNWTHVPPHTISVRERRDTYGVTVKAQF